MSRSQRTPRPKKPMPAGREASRPARAARPVVLAHPTAGRRIVVASWAATILLVATSAIGVADPAGLAGPALVVALAMFFGGTGVFAWSFVVALGRSRELDVGVAGVYGLSGSTPKPVRTRLFASIAVELAVAIAATAARPNSPLVFDFLAVMWGLGLAGLWGAYHGAFPARQRPPGRPRRAAG